jgi:pimeloyl-ACP methyl ester carboxylesterase
VQPDAPSDREPAAVQLPEGPVFVADEGRGPVLLAVHGVPGSHRDFRWLAPVVRERVRIVRPDLPGFGRTELAVSHRPDVRADLLVRVLDALEVERAAVLGHSLGGAVAVALAARHPDRVAGLALLCSVGLRRHRAYSPSARWLARALRVPGLGRALAGPLRRAFVSAGFSRSLSDRTLFESVYAVSEHRFAAHRHACARLVVPTFVAWTANDPMVEPEISRELGAACPSGPRHELASGGHNPQKSHAVELGGWLVTWMDELQSRSPCD